MALTLTLALGLPGNGGTEVESLIRRDVTSADDVTRALEEADENRSVAATAMNAHSSRSHLILQLLVTGTNRITGITATVLLHASSLRHRRLRGVVGVCGVVGVMVLFKGHRCSGATGTM